MAEVEPSFIPSYILDSNTKIAFSLDVRNELHVYLVFTVVSTGECKSESTSESTITLPLDPTHVDWLCDGDSPPAGSLHDLSVTVKSQDSVELNMLHYPKCDLSIKAWQKLKSIMPHVYNDYYVYGKYLKDRHANSKITDKSLLKNLLSAYLQIMLEKVQERLCVKCRNPEYIGARNSEVELTEDGHQANSCIKNDLAQRIAYMMDVMEKLNVLRVDLMLKCSGLGCLGLDTIQSILNELPLEKLANDNCYLPLSQATVFQFFLYVYDP